MSARGSLHLAWRYIAHHRTRTLLLALSLGLTLALPLLVRGMVSIAQSEFRTRAEVTPLVLGAKGSALELTLNALYFRRSGVDTIQAGQMDVLRATRLAGAIPLHVHFHSQEAAIVGTSLDYFSFRNLRIADGQMMTRLGDCVVGARVARMRDLHPGGFMYSSPEQVFNLAGAYPLKMRITGVLDESHSADDDAVFVDVKTSWLMSGIAHGHEDVVKNSDPKSVLEKRDDNVAVTNAVRMFTEVTAENLASFHFHGDPASFPLTAILCVPNDEKSRAILLGKFLNSTNSTQLVRPTEQMDALLTALFQARELALVLLAVLGVAVILIAALVFALSFKMRRREFATLEEIGVARSTLVLVKIFEIILIGLGAGAVVLGVLRLMETWGTELLRWAVR